MDKFNIIWKSVVSALPFILIVIALIVARSVYLMKKRNTGFSDWLLKEDGNEIRRLFAIERKRGKNCCRRPEHTTGLNSL